MIRVLIFFLIYCLFSCDFKGKVDNEENRYVSSELGFSVLNEFEWEITELKENIVILNSPLEDSLDNFAESVNLTREKAPGYDLNQYVEANLSSLKKYLKEVIIINPATDLKIDNQDFKTLTYSHTSMGFKTISLIYLGVKENVGYVISCNAKEEDFNDYKSQFERIVQSFKYL